MSLQKCGQCSTRYAAGLEACPHCGSAERAPEATPMLPTVEAVCTTEACPAKGRGRQVVARTVAPGVLGVPRLACASCGEWMEETMPKITRHGGPSNAADQVLEAETPSAPEDTAEPQDTPEPEADAKPTPKRRSRKAELVESSIQITAEAQVTRPDGTVA